jgi:hypothetical protein
LQLLRPLAPAAKRNDLPDRCVPMLAGAERYIGNFRTNGLLKKDRRPGNNRQPSATAKRPVLISSIRTHVQRLIET